MLVYKSHSNAMLYAMICVHSTYHALLAGQHAVTDSTGVAMCISYAVQQGMV